MKFILKSWQLTELIFVKKSKLFKGPFRLGTVVHKLDRAHTSII